MTAATIPAPIPSADIEAAFAAAVKSYQAGDFRAAADLFADVLKTAPDHADAMRLRGLALLRIAPAAGALPLLARARQLAPSNPFVHLHYGIGLLEAGRPARAAALFRRATVLLPNDVAPWINFSFALRALGQAGAARAAARRALAIDGQSAEAHYALGLAERTARNTPGARAAFLRAVELKPAFAEGWLNLGLACFQLGHLGDATHAMREALKARPGFSAAEASLAGFTLLQGDHEAALQRLRAVVARDPGCIAARLNLANILLLDHEPREVLVLLKGEVPAAREGAHWRAHRAMALLMLGRDKDAAAELDAIPLPYGDAEILIVWRRIALAERARDAETADRLVDRLETLVEDEHAALLEHRVIAHFDLAAYRARRNDRARAFGHWTSGHRLVARAQPFSRDDFKHFVDASIASFDVARLRNGPRASNVDRVPVFIAGLPRSGTSLTEQILAAHPMVHGAGERPQLHRVIMKLCGPALQAETVERLAALDAAALSVAADGFLSELHALDPAAAMITDKMPANCLHLGFLATLLPGARVILCRRDPRDIGLSIFQLRFFGYHPYAHDLADLGWYIGQHERLVAHWSAVQPVPMLEVALSDWVHDFNGTLTRLLDFLGLAYDSACERFYEQRRRVRTASAEQVRRPINARGLERWRRYEAELAPMLEELKSAGLIAHGAGAETA